MYSPSQPSRTRRKKLYRADRPARKKLHALARVETKPRATKFRRERLTAKFLKPGKA